MKKKSPISLTTNFQRVVCYVIIGLALYLVVYTFKLSYVRCVIFMEQFDSKQQNMAHIKRK